MIPDALALELVGDLATIPGFPAWDDRVCANTASHLVSMFDDAAEARRAVEAAIAEYGDWKGCGIPGIRAVRDADRARHHRWEAPYSDVQPEATACPECSDTGVSNASLLTSEVKPCTCPLADYERAAELNRRGAELRALRDMAEKHKPHRHAMNATALRLKRSLEDIGA